MDDTLNLNPACIQLDVTAADWQDAIVKACQPLIDQGYVLPGYPRDVIAREKQWATGLPTEPYGVAIPHALTPLNVVTAQVAACRLKTPVKFCQSGGTPGEDDVECSVVFVLALKDPQSQLSLLQKLMVAISNEAMLTALREAASPQEFNDIFTSASATM